MDEQTPRSLKVGIGLLTALLWLAAIGTAAYWTLRFRDNAQLAPANSRELGAPPPQAINWPSLSGRFGAEPKATQVANDIKVLGIVLPPGGQRSRAVLMVESTKATVVAEVGKEIVEGPLAGAVVERITPMEVTLNRSAGASVKLPVPDAKDAKNNSLVTYTANSSQSSANTYITPQPATPPSIQPALPVPGAPNPVNAAVQAARAAAQSAMGAQAPIPQTPPNGAEGAPPMRQPKNNER